MSASCYIGWCLTGDFCVQCNGFVTIFWLSSAPWYIKYIIFHSPPRYTHKHTTVLWVADGHRKNTCLTGNIWVNWNSLSHDFFSDVFHRSLSPCTSTPLLDVFVRSLPVLLAEIAPSPWTMCRLARPVMQFSEIWSPFCLCVTVGSQTVVSNCWCSGTCKIIKEHLCRLENWWKD